MRPVAGCIDLEMPVHADVFSSCAEQGQQQEWRMDSTGASGLFAADRPSLASAAFD